MGNIVDDEAWCDIVPMDARHILLGRPWLFDKNMIHLTQANTYLFHKDAKKLTLQPFKEELINTLKAVKTNNLLICHKFELESQDMGVVFALVTKKVHEDKDVNFNEFLVEIQHILMEFQELVGNALPRGLPPIRSIQHAIDLVLDATFPNLPAYRMPLIQQRQVEDLVAKGFVQEIKSPCAVFQHY